MNSEREFYDASYLFSRTVSDLMGESGINHDTFTDDEIEDMIGVCVSRGFKATWEEFVAWVLYGNDAKQRTLALIRAGRRGTLR